MVRFLKKACAALAGVAVFIAAAALIPTVIGGISHALFKTTDFPGGQPPARFVVALRVPGQGGAPDSYEPATWLQVSELRASKKKFSFLLEGKSADLTGRGDIYRYEVIEDRKTSQIIEVMFANTHTSWSRYEAFADRIVPISYRTDGSFLALIPVFAVGALGILGGLRVARLLRRALGVA